MKEPPTVRRGVALLIVLMALVLGLVVVGGLAREAAFVTVSREVRARAHLADDLSHAAEKAVLHWLTTRSGRVVLPPDVQEPRVSVLRDGWRVGGREYSVEITGYDQYGMAPAQALRRGSPLRLGVPDAALEVVDDLDHLPDPFGLDVLHGMAVRTGSELATCPAPAGAGPAWFGNPDEAGGHREEADRWGPVAIGGLIATHNPPPSLVRARRRSPRARAPRINVNTAPVPLLEVALRSAQRTGLDVIVESRARGRMAQAPPGGSLSEDGAAGSSRPQLMGVSDCWAFRIDARVDALERSWWVVFARENNEWSLIQRHRAPG